MELMSHGLHQTYDRASERLRAFTLDQGLHFLDEPAKHGPSPAEYRRDENCIRVASYLRGYDRLWALLHELGHHLSGASDEELIDDDLGTTEAVADHIALAVLQQRGWPVDGPQMHLEAVMTWFPGARNTAERHADLIAASADQLLAVL